MTKHHHHHGQHCHELLAQISAYIEGDLETQLCAQLEQHLANCDNCRILVDTTQKTILLFQRDHQQQRPADLPPDVNARLWQALDQAGCFSSPKKS